MSDSFRAARSGSPGFGWLLALVMLPSTALAQTSAAANPAAAPQAPPATAAPPAASEPAAPVPAVAPDAAPAPEPGARAQAEPTAESDDGEAKRDKRDKRDKQREDGKPPDADEGEANGKRGKHDVRVKGRLFALSELSHRRETVVSTSGGLETRDRNALDLSLQSGRFGVEYRSPLRFLSLELELELAGTPRVRDAFLEVGKRFFVKAGQFKIPSAALELESPWTLPLVRRGLIHDLMTDWLDVAGRRPGVAVGYRGKGGLKPRLTLGAFQGTTLEQVVPGDRDVNLIEQAALDAQTYAGRAAITLAMVTLGAWFEQRVGSTVAREFSHFATFGVDAELAHSFTGSALRLWVDGSAGESLYVNADKPGDDPHPWFVTGRALAGYRFGGLVQGDPYVEPFGFFALMDPDTEVVDDFTTEAALGVAAGYWDRFRVTLQGEITNAQRNLPTGFLDNQNPDRSSILLQAGARF